MKHYRGQNNNIVDERENKRSNHKKNHDDQIAGENVTKSIVTASQKPDRLEQHRATTDGNRGEKFNIFQKHAFKGKGEIK